MKFWLSPVQILSYDKKTKQKLERWLVRGEFTR